MSVESKRQIWAAEQARQIFPVDDDIAELADEIYSDMVKAKVKRLHGERQGGALHGLGFKAWLGPWGAWSRPETPRARERILASLSHKPYHHRLAGIGLVGHPQRRVPLRAEWLKPYCRVGDPQDGSGAVMWGLGPSRGRDELFKSHYDYLALKVWDGGEVVAQRESETLETGHTLSELRLDDDDYRFEVHAINRANHTRSGWRYDYAVINDEWTRLPNQGRDWDGEYGDSGITHTAEDRVAQPTRDELRARLLNTQRIAHENATYGHLAARYDTGTVEQYLDNAIDAGNKRSADLWSIVLRIQDELAAAAALEFEGETDEDDPRADVIAYIRSVRDNPPNRAVRGNPVHIRKWNRALAALGVSGLKARPWTPAEIRARATKWPDSPWARVASVL